ncbi:predicted protein [Streptomyces pristinaespiralis ATCC 25486]|uniref:Predicted protein n=1 Tax=Streptomyces pristinaespiralis (strain ATCC 25486 / DSM 40338 / CBS 914.69 / JCM 4507 / KCC S-0507 / NBRC 13074 / NRRL 2958 / 5647) TaxID=457429 RepID=D6X7N1_STRE2|nr:predicted protein [Streptomyces pristinaespiralis ATCC 25486]
MDPFAAGVVSEVRPFAQGIATNVTGDAAPLADNAVGGVRGVVSDVTPSYLPYGI